MYLPLCQQRKRRKLQGRSGNPKTNNNQPLNCIFADFDDHSLQMTTVSSPQLSVTFSVTYVKQILTGILRFRTVTGYVVRFRTFFLSRLWHFLMDGLRFRNTAAAAV